MRPLRPRLHALPMREEFAKQMGKSPSNVDGSRGAGSGSGRATEKAATSSGRPTSSHVPRTMRLLSGRSRELRLDRLRERSWDADIPWL